MNRFFHYINLTAHIYSLFLFRAMTKRLRGEDGNMYRNRYKLELDDGSQKTNPVFSKNKIEFLIPLTPTIINTKIIDQYVNDHKSSIDFLFYEARIASYIKVRKENCYSEKEDGSVGDSLAKVTWSFNMKKLIASTFIWIGILTSITVLLFVIF